MKSDILNLIPSYLIMFIMIGAFMLAFVQKIKDAQEELDRNDLSKWGKNKAKISLEGGKLFLLILGLMGLLVLIMLCRHF